MRLRFSSKKTSSLSPQVSAAAVSVPSAIDRAASFAGCRNTTRTHCRPSSRAIGKFPPAPGVGHLATVARLLRSTTTTERSSGRFTKMCSPPLWRRKLPQLDVGELAIALDIDDRESAATVAHEDTLLVRLDADVVCVIPELDRWPFLEGRAVKDPQRPVPAARDVECVRGAHVADALRFSKALQPLQSPLCSQIDHAHAPVSELRHEQTLPPKIHCDVIDSPPDLAERDLCFEAERRRFLAMCRCDEDRAERNQDRAYPSRQ